MKDYESEFVPRIKWSDWEYGTPMRVIITDWALLRKETFFYKDYLIVPAKMDYKQRRIELCLPYHNFITELKKQRQEVQQQVIQGKAVIELVKIQKTRSMVIKKIEVL